MSQLIVSRPAFAKINLYLHVTGRRDDGYHELDSLVAFANVGDTVTAEAADTLSLAITGPFAQALADDDENNLVLKAARALAGHAGVPALARLTLDKTLPVASGIGGGSADAAATLLALTELWGRSLTDAQIAAAARQLTGHDDTRRALETLFQLWRDDVDLEALFAIALDLGADVPVCLEGRAVFMGGIGERLDLAPHLPPAWLVLVNPGVAVSTPAVFKARDGAFSASARFSETPQDAAHLAHLLSARRNDLTQAALSLAPEIGEALARLDATAGVLLTRMSGSGATVFGLYASSAEASAAAQTIAHARPGWWVEAARLLDGPPAAFEIP